MPCAGNPGGAGGGKTRLLADLTREAALWGELPRAALPKVETSPSAPAHATDAAASPVQAPAAPLEPAGPAAATGAALGAQPPALTAAATPQLPPAGEARGRGGKLEQLRAVALGSCGLWWKDSHDFQCAFLDREAMGDGECTAVYNIIRTAWNSGHPDRVRSFVEWQVHQ